eukprot:1206094-Lingulodinium_polyedra.AAC.1
MEPSLVYNETSLHRRLFQSTIEIDLQLSLAQSTTGPSLQFGLAWSGLVWSGLLPPPSAAAGDESAAGATSK